MELNKNQKNYIQELLKQLSLEEKLGMIHGSGLFHTEGAERLGIPMLIMSDGPMGVRNEFEDDKWKVIGDSDDYVSYLPCNSAIAATWNRELAYELGKVLGEEARGRGKDVILAPGINIIRTPLCGRNFEYMSEDPYLIAETAVPLIKGIQENDVAACVKHFAANNQETERLWVDVQVEERALREIYLSSFYEVIKKSDVYSVMGAYNRLRGEHCSQSKFLLNRILREEWNYDGVVISDWGAVHDTKAAAESSLDIEMSVDTDFHNNYMADPLYKSIKNGEISETAIDEKVKRILGLMIKLNMLHGNRKPGTYNTPEHRKVILEAARESVVLLKNDEGRLPLKPDHIKKLAVIGVNAECIHSDGGGSSEIKALYEISPLMGIKTKLGGNVKVTYAKGYYVEPKKEEVINWQELSLDEKVNARKVVEEVGESVKLLQKELLEEAVRVAREADEVILIGGLDHNFDIEGRDRESMKLPYAQDELIEEVLEVRPDAIVVMVAGSPVDMERWSGKAKAIVWSWYAGMEGGSALAEVLFGMVNPSGKLPWTCPKCIEDTSVYQLGEIPEGKSITYHDGIYVGYRYFDSYKVAPAFCFGHGLSYTVFEYKNLIIEQDKQEEIHFNVRLTIKNAGLIRGAETVQIYVTALESTVEKPNQELKGYFKVYLEPEEEKEITVPLTESAFSYYDVIRKEYVAEKGKYLIKAGSSSGDIRLEGLLVLE